MRKIFPILISFIFLLSGCAAALIPIAATAVVGYHSVKKDKEPPVIELTSSELESGFIIVKGKKEIEIKGSVEDNADIKSFKIKGKDIPLDSLGRFSYIASLAEGENYFELKALDVHGNEMKKMVVVKYNFPVVARTYNATERELPHKVHVTSARWALVIGISKYQDTRIPSLRYASSDALSFYTWLVSPDGGRYSPARVRLLLNQKATSKNVKSALFKWLKQAIEEDILTIYFAGHGSPDSPDSPDNLFLLTYDVQYGNIAATGFPMWDIETALKRFIRAKKIIVLADACHSGGVGKSFDIARRSGRGINMNPINSGLQDLSEVDEGVCVISASADKEVSQESKKWGGGHGVFTYYLLKGLKGQADYNKDSCVTLGELIPFLSEKVRRETRNAQSPIVAGKFDPAMSIGEVVQSMNRAEQIHPPPVEAEKKRSVKDPVSKPIEIGRDETYIAYANGIVRDTKTGLEWVAGPDRDMSWYEAKDWGESLNINGGGWRIPKVKELETLHKKGIGKRNMTPLLKTTGYWVWSGKREGSSSAWGFFFYFIGFKTSIDCNTSGGSRGFAVRSRSDG